jgi:hypothetical protein
VKVIHTNLMGEAMKTGRKSVKKKKEEKRLKN